MDPPHESTTWIHLMDPHFFHFFCLPVSDQDSGGKISPRIKRYCGLDLEDPINRFAMRSSPDPDLHARNFRLGPESA
jgi:hypothetical protein